MNRDEILDKAKSIINGERQGTYGEAEDSFTVIANLWSSYLYQAITPADVANMMILMKVARNSSGVYKDDNWIDICGYAALGGEIQGKTNDSNKPANLFADEFIIWSENVRKKLNLTEDDFKNEFDRLLFGKEGN